MLELLIRLHARDHCRQNGTIRTKIHAREVSKSNCEVTSLAALSAAARSYPVPSPGRYGRYGYPGSYQDTDTSREDVEVALPRRIWYECNFNYQVGAVE